MTNKDKGQFLAEIKMIGLQKEFKGLFGEYINPLNLFKKVDKILDTRKTSYNYAFVMCCERNGIKNIDNIYKDLEKTWSDCKQKLNYKDLIPILLFRSSFLINKYKARISEKWNEYIQKTIDYAGTLDDVEPAGETN